MTRTAPASARPIRSGSAWQPAVRPESEVDKQYPPRARLDVNPIQILQRWARVFLRLLVLQPHDSRPSVDMTTSAPIFVKSAIGGAHLDALPAPLRSDCSHLRRRRRIHFEVAMLSLANIAYDLRDELVKQGRQQTLRLLGGLRQRPQVWPSGSQRIVTRPGLDDPNARIAEAMHSFFAAGHEDEVEG